MILENENEQDDTEIEEMDIEKNNDNEDINDSEELEEKKREVNQFNIERNSAQNQIFIQDIGAGGFTVNYYAAKMEPIVSKLPVEKRFDLRKQEECIEFVETFKDTEYFTTAVLLCIFEAVILTDLSDLRAKLDSCLPQNYQSNTGNEEASTVLKDNSYTSLNSIFTVIGANKLVTEDGKLCVSIGENSIQALINMLEQFPVIHNLFVNFIILMTQDNRYHTIFYDSQLASSFSESWSAEVIDLRNSIYPELCANPENAYLLGNFVYKLYKKRERDGKAILWQCLTLEKTWLWRVVSYAYILFEKNNIAFPFEKEFRALLVKKVNYLRKNDFYFLAELLIQSEYFRDMICCVFSSAYKRAGKREKQNVIAQTYVYLVRRGYYRVNSFFIRLPLVACDTKQQQLYLVDILERVMSDYHLRKQMYVILKAYLKELSQYHFSQTEIKHIAAFCYNMSSSNEEYREDIKEMLQECGSKVAKRVADLL